MKRFIVIVVVLFLSPSMSGANPIKFLKTSKFYIGYTNYKNGKYEDAVRILKDAIAKEPLIGDHVKYFLAESCLRLGDNDCAIEYFQNVADDSESVWKNDAHFGLARTYLVLGQAAEAMKAIEGFKLSKTSGPLEAEYDLLKASILGKLGKNSEAVHLLKSVYFDAGSKRTMDEALKELKEIDSPEAGNALNYIESPSGRVQLAEQLMKRQSYSEGIDILKRFQDGTRHMKELLADAYFEARVYAKAKDLYAELISKEKAPLEHYLRLAKSAARSNDFETAIKTYQGLLQKYPKGEQALTYNYKLGFLYMDSKQYEDAVKKFLELAGAGHGGHLRKDILWNLGWSYYRLGQLDDAIEYFQRVTDGGFGGGWRLKGTYWIARCREKMGKKDEARTIYNELIDDDGLGYYGHLAAGRLHGKKKDPLSGSSKKDCHSRESGNPINLDAGKDSPPFEKGGMGGISKSEYLSNLGLFDLVWMEQGGGKGQKELFLKLVGKYSKEFGIDKGLVSSMMWQESRFNPYALSRVGAIGLMQLIPPTAEKLAGELGVEDFSTKELYNPDVNVRFGVKYLSDLSKLFSGEKTYMIASYNAGEDAVSRWVKNSDANDIEEFIEEIPYEETNNYVKIVLKNYWSNVIPAEAGI